ncbi:regulatory protein, luxR family [Paenibacillus sp. UNC496MF]|uniref:helix-turn-helix transcriptional regulator n=1 Tax=Paenibacillus sp. UNC496MF TaxID=1502753 RepID=UPI0008EE6B34|nr:regulatory protein, luxR family [Paenibacillus sp. UNC496MF]
MPADSKRPRGGPAFRACTCRWRLRGRACCSRTGSRSWRTRRSTSPWKRRRRTRSRSGCPACAAKARVYLAEDRPADAKKAIAPLGLSEKDKPAFNREYEYATLARLLLRQRKYSAVIRLLAWLKPQAEREGLLSSLAELALLLALAEHGRGRRADAFAALREALAVGEANGYVRSFADEGLAAAELLAAFPAAAPAEAKPAGLVEPLLESELALMDLVRRGASNQEIAGELALSLGTVKVYLSRVYGKLGVSSRTQALNRAEQLGLLEHRG